MILVGFLKRCTEHRRCRMDSWQTGAPRRELGNLRSVTPPSLLIEGLYGEWCDPVGNRCSQTSDSAVDEGEPAPTCDLKSPQGDSDAMRPRSRIHATPGAWILCLIFLTLSPSGKPAARKRPVSFGSVSLLITGRANRMCPGQMAGGSPQASAVRVDGHRRDDIQPSPKT
jgi:hypothetical protein